MTDNNARTLQQDQPCHSETLYLIGLLLPLLELNDTGGLMTEDQQIAYGRLAGRVKEYS